MKGTMSSNGEWVLQELCYLSRTKNGEYQDIIVFLADGEVRGIASRISEKEIVNAAKEGRVRLRFCVQMKLVIRKG